MFSRQQLRRLIFPLIVEQILAITVGMVDTMMISYAGEAAISGVSLVDMINVLLINIFAAVATWWYPSTWGMATGRRRAMRRSS